MAKKRSSSPSVVTLPVERIEQKILLIRDQKVMLDSDLAELYGVETKVLNQAVRRNLRRFPVDFMFRINQEEFDILRSQFVTSSWGGRRTKPYAFTEQGVAMLSSVLKSARAVEVNIQIMRTFVKLREILSTHKDLARKLAELEKQYAEHDRKFQLVFDAIRKLMEPPPTPKKRRIGFHAARD
jgi:phage regulator Rha-like protein